MSDCVAGISVVEVFGGEGVGNAFVVCWSGELRHEIKITLKIRLLLQ